MRQAGVIAAAALYALRNQVDDLVLDHDRAQHVAHVLADTNGVLINPAEIDTNLVYFSIDPEHPIVRDNDGSRFLRKLAESGVLITGGGCRFRAVLHRDLSQEEVERGVERIRAVIEGAA